MFFDLEPASPRGELPRVFANPFDHAVPHPLARIAAAELVDRLRSSPVAAQLAEPGGGKMFGVLVVADGDRIGYLAGFSGMLGGRWHVEGFVPPLFDLTARDAIWPRGQADLRELDLALRALEADPDHAAARAALLALNMRQDLAWRAVRDRHQTNRAERHAARDRVPLLAGDRGERLHAIDQQSRGDAAELRTLAVAHAEARRPVVARVTAFDERRASLERRRADESRTLMRAVHDAYVIANGLGERRPLRELFPGEPPAGAGDCAGPKLLGEAYRRALRPLALAELWWGAPPATGGRIAGSFYPSCRGKCGPLLPFMLQGLVVPDAVVYGAEPIAAAEPRVVFEDASLIVVDKPVGLLSVPGRSGQLRDCVQTRLRAHGADAFVVHRLDLDTSGLLVVAKNRETHAALQQQFARREIVKHYTAVLDGVPAREHGVVELALRVDLDDRPRQIHDPILGKPATTAWRVVETRDGRARVALVPHTGRTHQLRVHAAHPLGIGVPIAGDRLYGRAHSDGRLLLHAASLAFVHPRTRQRLELDCPAPF